MESTVTSGSICGDHKNVIGKKLADYEVESVTLKTLLVKIGLNAIDYLKLDIEGAEYELLEKVKAEDLAGFKQIFIEFHHHCTSHTKRDTKTAVELLEDKGYLAFSFDDRNYLFLKAI
jgi:hypothetical protein